MGSISGIRSVRCAAGSSVWIRQNLVYYVHTLVGLQPDEDEDDNCTLVVYEIYK